MWKIKKMKKIIKKTITKLFFKYCFKESELAHQFIAYYVPGIIDEHIPGTYLFGKLNEKMEEWEPIAKFEINAEGFNINKNEKDKT
jgi:hypothetical protein